jgi:hypothetical protein
VGGDRQGRRHRTRVNACEFPERDDPLARRTIFLRSAGTFCHYPDLTACEGGCRIGTWPHVQTKSCGQTAPRNEHTRQQEALARPGKQRFRPADQLDYRIRRWVIPPSLQADPSVECRPSVGVRRAAPRSAASIQSSGLLREVQSAIGRHLCAEYDVTQPIPARLSALLRQLEQRNASDGISRNSAIWA